MIVFLNHDSKHSPLVNIQTASFYTKNTKMRQCTCCLLKHSALETLTKSFYLGEILFVKSQIAFSTKAGESNP